MSRPAPRSRGQLPRLLRPNPLVQLLAPLLQLLLLLPAVAQGCTVLQFSEHAFSANAVRLLHALPVFEGTNGTLFLDATLSTHKCHPDGGWHDFFDLGAHAVPWTKAEEAAGGEVCARYNLGQVDEVVQQTGLGWDELLLVSIRRVWNFQPWMKKQLVHALRGLEQAAHPTIAFHVKAAGHTLVQKHLALSPQDYVNLFVRTFPNVKNGTCVIAGGDEALNAETQALAGRLIGCKPFNRTLQHLRAGVAPGVANTSSLNGACMTTRNLLTDIEMLAHADYFVGTGKSGLSPIIETLRFALYGKPRRTFLLHGGDWYDRIRDFFRNGGGAMLQQEQDGR